MSGVAVLFVSRSEARPPRHGRVRSPLRERPLRAERSVRLLDEIERVVELHAPDVPWIHFGLRDESEVIRPAVRRDDGVGHDAVLRGLDHDVRSEGLSGAAEGRMHQPAARVADGHVLDLLAGVELDVANPEGLAGDDGLREPVRILDEFGRPDDRR